MINSIKHELNNRPIAAIDSVLKAFSAKKRATTHIPADGLITLFCQAALSVIKGSKEALSMEKPIDAIFDQNLSREHQHFIAICLLRLLCTNDEWFEKDVQFRVKAFNLFDKVLSADLYKQFNIDLKDQTYDKISKLKDIVPTAESDMRTIITSLNSLDVLSTFRHRFTQIINSALCKAILWPFLQKQLLDVRLAEIFSAVQSYYETKGPRMLQAFQQANKTTANYLLEAEEYGTYYSIQYLGGMAKRLEDLLEKHFSESELSKPAELVVKKSEKKYPFYSEGKDLSLSFIIQNTGPGHAFDIRLKVLKPRGDIQTKWNEINLGALEPTSMVVEIPARVIMPVKSSSIFLQIIWVNFDKSTANKKFEFELEGQRPDIDWETLPKMDPYSLEPVETEDALVGRREIFGDLIARAQAKSIGSSYIFGQKRVGKTSIAKTLKTHLMSANISDYLVVYMEGGEYIGSNSTDTIRTLGERICEIIKYSDRRFADLNIPEFIDTLSPLSKFLDLVLRCVPSYRVLFILDEFDELPIELYKPGPVGDAFFLTMRSISGKQPFAFILVGSENMEFIMSFQGEALNKFQSIRLDYFDREKYWFDFQELVRRPVTGWFEFTEDSFISLYEQSSGNPFFTKLICGRLFKIMVERRDCHVTRSEIEEAAKQALQHDTAANRFQHFWSDGIFETGSNFEEVSMRRRKVLLCLSEAFRQHGIAEKEDIIDRGIKSFMIEASAIESDLREFERRKVLIAKENCYDCNVPFFREWLKERGVSEIITTFSDLDAILLHKKEESEAYVRSDEIVRLINKWGPYKGRRITEDLVRAWLAQFGDNINQRLMFQILKELSFYSSDLIRAKMKEAHGIVVRGLARRIEKGKRKRADILISYLDSPGKSGSQYAKLYADENDIYYTNVVERSRLKEELLRRPGLQALVFIDDIIGTGLTVRDGFYKLNADCGATLRGLRLKLFFISVCGFEEQQTEIEDALVECNLPMNVHVCDLLDASAKCFSDNTRIFPNPKERQQAKNITYQCGVKLVSNAPLGFGDCQAAVVFEQTCPDNSLPILWSESKDWIPLFPR
ncbi:MAG: ATP-binding protein [Dehalococcoidia bacterium]|nr:ATP-binding protein [Dehalococcoidia bacterium]